MYLSLVNVTKLLLFIQQSSTFHSCLPALSNGNANRSRLVVLSFGILALAVQVAATPMFSSKTSGRYYEQYISKLIT